MTKPANYVKNEGDSKAQILDAIKTPLSFFALALLIVEASLTVIVVSGRMGQDQTYWSVMIMACLFILVVFAVTVLTYRVPAHLMARLQNVARKEARNVSVEITSSVLLLQSLRRLKYDLDAFDKNSPIDEYQENKRVEGLTQNPFLVYVRPEIEGILNNPKTSEFIDKETRAKLTKMLSTPWCNVGQFLIQLDEIIRKFD